MTFLCTLAIYAYHCRQKCMSEGGADALSAHPAHQTFAHSSHGWAGSMMRTIPYLNTENFMSDIGHAPLSEATPPNFNFHHLSSSAAVLACCCGAQENQNSICALIFLRAIVCRCSKAPACSLPSHPSGSYAAVNLGWLRLHQQSCNICSTAMLS